MASRAAFALAGVAVCALTAAGVVFWQSGKGTTNPPAAVPAVLYLAPPKQAALPPAAAASPLQARDDGASDAPAKPPVRQPTVAVSPDLVEALRAVAERPDPESVFWQSISASTNPADFEAYIQQFPQGTFLPLARSRLAALAPHPAPAVVADDTTWPDEDRRAVQAGLAALGLYHGPVNGSFATETRTAILHWQALNGSEETARLSAEQRDQILAEARQQASLLAVAVSSPRGTASESIRGAEARFNRGADFERGDRQPKDLSEAAYRYALAATNGWAAAFTNLGTLYVRGLVGGKPYPEAAGSLWLAGAAFGDGTAMFNLGILAERGIGMPADAAAAKRWYARGAERKHAGSVAALQRLGG